MFKFLKGLFSSSKADILRTPVRLEEPATSKKTRAAGYRAEVLAEHGFEIPASNVDKNLLGKEFERAGDVGKAIACYEGCIKNNFEGSYPYDRLAIIFRRANKLEDEIRILERAIMVYSRLLGSGNYGVEDKLKGYEKRLNKAKQLMRKANE